MIMTFAIFDNILEAFGWCCMIFWLVVALRRYGHFLGDCGHAGGCEEVLGDWGWLWVVVTILWVFGDDWGWL